MDGSDSTDLSCRCTLGFFFVDNFYFLGSKCRDPERKERGRLCVRSGGPRGPCGRLMLNERPREVTGLIENRLGGDGNAFAACLAP